MLISNTIFQSSHSKLSLTIMVQIHRFYNVECLFVFVHFSLRSGSCGLIWLSRIWTWLQSVRLLCRSTMCGESRAAPFRKWMDLDLQPPTLRTEPRGERQELLQVLILEFSVCPITLVGLQVGVWPSFKHTEELVQTATSRTWCSVSYSFFKNCSPKPVECPNSLYLICIHDFCQTVHVIILAILATIKSTLY